MKKILLLLFLLTGMGSYAQYCTTGLYSNGCTFGDDLDYIILGNYTQSPTGCDAGNFGDYTTDTIDLQQAVSYSFTTATTYTFGSEYMGAWIDFNNDQDFDDSGEFVATSGSTSFGAANPYTTTLNVGMAPLGTYRFRVRIRWNSSIVATNSCTSFTYGETHDYIINVLPAPACPPPFALTASNVNNVSADLSWTSPGASSWTLIYGPAGFNPANSGTVVNSATNPYTLSGLTSITSYDFYVIGDCGSNGLSDTSLAGNFTTLCSPFTASYIKDFENDSLDFAPDCWFVEKTVSGAFIEVEDFRPSVSGSRHLQMYSSGSTSADILRIFSPQFSDLTAGDKQISFWVNTSNINNSLYVGTASAQQGGVLSPIDTITFNATDSYQEIIIPLTTANGYNGTDQFIYLAHSNGATYTYIDIDDFAYTIIPACPKITSINHLGSTSTSATFGFSSSGNSFDWEYGPVGFLQGTGTMGNSTSNPFTITGLAPQNTYDIYIRNNCSAGGNGFSVYSGPITFSTICNTFATPYYESFDNWPLNCWDTTGGTHYWAPYTGTGTDNYVMANFWNVSSGNYLLKLPPVALTASSQVRFSWSHLSSSSYPDDQLLVRVRSLGSTSWDTLINLKASDGNFNSPNSGNTTPGTFIEEISLIPASYVGDTVIVEIRGVSGYGPNVFINNFYLEDAPLCIPTTLTDITVGGITSDSVYTYWNPGDGVKWMVEVGNPGFTPGSQTGIDSMVVSDTTAGFGSLIPNTTYQFYLKDSCASGSISPWVGPVSFTTACLSAVMPLYESLDIWPIACWDSTAGSIKWEKYNGTAGDNYAMADFWGNSSGNMILSSPPVSISQDAQIRFKWSHLYSTSYPDDELLVRVKIAGTTNWDTLMSLKGPTNFNDPGAANTTPGSFTEEEILLNPTIYTGQNVLIEFVGVTDYGPNLFLNDIYVEAAPTCPKLSSAVLVSASDTSATISWQTGSNANSYQVWYGPQGFFQGTQTVGATKIITTSIPFTIDSLTASTCYEFLVRGICAAGDTSQWTAPVIFCTPCPVLSAPYIEDFENHLVGHYNGDDQCWSFTSKNPGTTPSGGFSWEVRNTPQTTSSNTGPAGDNTFYPQTGGKWIHSDNSGGSGGDSTMLISPLVDISGLTAPELEYHFHNYAIATSGSRQPLYVDVFDGSVWHNKVHDIDTVYQSSATAAWKDTIIDLLPYSSNGVVRVRFRTKITRSPGGSGDVAIDDIRISDPFSCFKPQNLSATAVTAATATLSWGNNPASTGTNFLLSYGSSLSNPNAGTQVAVTGNSYNLTGLSAAANYCFYVREVCAPGDSSLWVGPFCFNTPCLSFNTPYLEDFDVWPLNCWDETGGSNNFAASPGATGFYARANFWGWPDDSAMLTSPLVNIVSDSRIRFSWSHLYSSSYPNDQLIVRVRKLGGPWTTVMNLIGPSFNDTSAGNTTAGYFIEDTILLNPAVYNNSTIQVQLKAISDYGPDLFINDLYIEEIVAGCPVPDSLSVSNLTCTGVDMKWGAKGSGPSLVEYGPAGFTPGTGAGTLTWSTSPLTISGLSLGTNYDFYVADTCALDTSAIAGPYTFTTPTGPLTAGFSSTINSASLVNQQVDFDASSSAGASTYTWDFGDGSAAGSGMIVSHNYTSNGAFNVTLVINGPCGTDSITKLVTTSGISLEETMIGKSLDVYPNPAKNLLNVTFDSNNGGMVKLSLSDLSGKQIMSKTYDMKGAHFEEILDISSLAKGTYMLQIESGDLKVIRRVLKQ